MSAFEVNLIMSADSIKIFFLVFAMVSFFASIFYYTEVGVYGRDINKFIVKAAILSGVPLLLAFIIPSTKVLTAMYAVDFIQSDPAAAEIKKEGSEIYGLMKKILIEKAEGGINVEQKQKSDD